LLSLELSTFIRCFGANTIFGLFFFVRCCSCLKSCKQRLLNAEPYDYSYSMVNLSSTFFISFPSFAANSNSLEQQLERERQRLKEAKDMISSLISNITTNTKKFSTWRKNRLKKRGKYVKLNLRNRKGPQSGARGFSGVLNKCQCKRQNSGAEEHYQYHA